MRCDECQLAMLDELYGLLEPEESAGLAAHVATCPACAAAFARAKADQATLQTASTLSFPALTFAPPVEPAVIVPSTYADPPEKSVRATWLGWAVAAGLLLAASGTLGPALRTLTSHQAFSRDLAATKQEVTEAERAFAEKKAAFDAALAMANEPVEKAKQAHDAVVTEWISAEATAASARPFAVTVRGPAAALPGAPNVYSIAAVNDAEVAVAARIVTALKGKSGKEYFSSSVETADGRGVNLRVPASAWVGVPANESLTLHVTATNLKTNQSSQLDEPIRVSAPVYSTVLTTDAPLYRPGDTIRFRSLTLDRTRFLPPDRDLNLAYALIGPDGKVVNGLTLTGSTRLKTSANGQTASPVLGPDGLPVKGVGSGELRLADNTPGGAYKLAVYELPIGWNSSQLPPGLTPLATRPVMVQSYAAHVWAKTLTFDHRTYGPGETVTAKLRVTEQGRPVANAQLMPDATVDGQPLLALRHPPTTDAAGEATLTMDLPKGGDFSRGVLTVRVIKNQVNETIVRPIPLAPRNLTVEFFPEGGDLVAGVPNRVYVRGKLADGSPADFDGTILDGDTPVATVRSETDADQPGANRGVGVVTFTPKAGVSYSFRIRHPMGLVNPVVALPVVKADGVALTIPKGVVASDEPIRVTVTSPTDKKLVIGAYTRGTPISHTAVALKGGEAQVVDLTPDVEAPGGVTRVTVFEEPAGDGPGRRDLTPVAERLIFRTQTRRLDLAVTVNSNEVNEPAPGGGFRPGQNLSLDITAKTEVGRPTAAILFASVAAETLYAATDDETDRGLPTHFLLGGEVERPDALEHADFLLTNHPKAAVALDRLLGTQGWRRFAEQNPAEFRKKAKPDDADRLLLAVGSTAPVPANYKPAVRRVIDSYTPKYETALAALERAESSRAAVRVDSEPARAVASASSRYQPAAARFNALVAEYRNEAGGSDERNAGVYGVLLLAGAATIVLLLRFTLWRTLPERGLITKVAIGLLALTGVVALVEAVASPPTDLLLTVPQEMNVRPQASGTTLPEAANATAVSLPSGVESLSNRSFPVVPTPNPVDGGKGILLETDQSKFDANRPNAMVRVASPGASPQARERLKSGAVTRLREVGDVTEGIVAAVASQPPMVVREYAHSQMASDVRTNFSEVVYWHPVIVVSGDGKPTIPILFQISDAITSYRVSVAGHTPDGRLGHTTTRITVAKPLAAGLKVPPEVGLGDKVDLVETVSYPAAKSGPNLYVRGTNVTFATTPADESVPMSLNESGSARRVVRATPKAVGEAEVRVIAQTNDTRLRDIISKRITIAPAGSHASGRATALLDRTAAIPVTIPRDRVPGTLTVSVVATPNALAALESSVGGLAKGPAACFEQATASTYPSVLMLRWLESQKADGPQSRRLAEEAKARLPGTYRTLTSFECDKPGGGKEGFDWFGGATPHEALTAYGLTHLRDLSAVHAVDPALVNRTTQYLLSLRDGKGGFRLSERAQDSFGRAPASVTNAYLVWALTEADATLDLTNEKSAVTKDALASGDPYRLALAGLATKSADVLKRLATLQDATGGVPGAATSITNSAGLELVTETTALATLAWLGGGGEFDTNVRKSLAFLHSRRQPGGTYGATQATVLALKAFVEAAKRPGANATGGTVVAYVNGNRIGEIDLKQSTTLTIPNAESLWQSGKAEVRLESANATVPVAVEWTYRTEAITNPTSPTLTFNAAIAATRAKEGDPIALTVSVSNPTAKDHGMVVAVVGIPAGLVVPTDAKQLKDWPKRAAAGEVVPAFWEWKGRELVLYWRSLKAGQAVTANVDFVAEYPGEYAGPASKAYPYYDPSGAITRPPMSIIISPR